jgi:hypothetical protein
VAWKLKIEQQFPWCTHDISQLQSSQKVCLLEMLNKGLTNGGLPFSQINSPHTAIYSSTIRVMLIALHWLISSTNDRKYIRTIVLTYIKMSLLLIKSDLLYKDELALYRQWFSI